jgi:stage III sporulation protein AG
LIVVLAGVILLLLPSFGGASETKSPAENEAGVYYEPFSVPELEGRMEEALSEISGGQSARGAGPEEPGPNGSSRGITKVPAVRTAAGEPMTAGAAR